MRTGYVGLGARIANVSNCLQNVSSEIDPCAYVDPSPAGLKHVEARSGNTLSAYDDLEGMLRLENLDLLMIGSPNFMHMDHLRAALKSDVRYIFCEKPIVTSEAETFELLELMKAHDGARRVLVGLVLRYSPLYAELKKSLAAGQIGKRVVAGRAGQDIGCRLSFKHQVGTFNGALCRPVGCVPRAFGDGTTGIRLVKTGLSDRRARITRSSPVRMDVRDHFLGGVLYPAPPCVDCLQKD